MLKPGQTLEPAMLSPIVGGRIRLWAGRDSLVFGLDDPSAAAQHLGRGTVARTSVAPGRYREVGLYERTEGTLILTERLVTPRDRTEEVLAKGSRFGLRPDSAPPPSPSDWSGFCEWLKAIIPAAAAKGEFVVLERGGWDHRAEPYALVICVPARGAWNVMIETIPAPPPGGVWPPSADPSAPNASVSAPASLQVLEAAAVFLVDAAIHWAASPLDLAVTYGACPDGPCGSIGQ